MGILESQFGIIWRAIKYWMDKKGLYPAELVYLPGYPEHVIKRGIKNGSEWLSSDFVLHCFERLGLMSARLRGPEDTADILTDEEIVAALTAPLIGTVKQGRFQI